MKAAHMYSVHSENYADWQLNGAQTENENEHTAADNEPPTQVYFGHIRATAKLEF